MYGLELETLATAWIAEGSSQWAEYPYGTVASETHIFAAGGEYNSYIYAFALATGGSQYNNGVFCPVYETKPRVKTQARRRRRVI